MVTGSNPPPDGNERPAPASRPAPARASDKPAAPSPAGIRRRGEAAVSAVANPSSSTVCQSVTAPGDAEHWRSAHACGCGAHRRRRAPQRIPATLVARARRPARRQTAVPNPGQRPAVNMPRQPLRTVGDLLKPAPARPATAATTAASRIGVARPATTAPTASAHCAGRGRQRLPPRRRRTAAAVAAAASARPAAIARPHCTGAAPAAPPARSCRAEAARAEQNNRSAPAIRCRRFPIDVQAASARRRSTPQWRIASIRAARAPRSSRIRSICRRAARPALAIRWSSSATR